MENENMGLKVLKSHQYQVLFLWRSFFFNAPFLKLLLPVHSDFQAQS